jgi:hypothetical protein
MGLEEPFVVEVVNEEVIWVVKDSWSVALLSAIWTCTSRRTEGEKLSA